MNYDMETSVGIRGESVRVIVNFDYEPEEHTYDPDSAAFISEFVCIYKVKASGTDIMDDLSREQVDALLVKCCEYANDRMQYEKEKLNAMREDEEKNRWK